jgi:hypothetical protein
VLYGRFLRPHRYQRVCARNDLPSMASAGRATGTGTDQIAAACRLLAESADQLRTGVLPASCQQEIVQEYGEKLVRAVAGTSPGHHRDDPAVRPLLAEERQSPTSRGWSPQPWRWDSIRSGVPPDESSAECV